MLRDLTAKELATIRQLQTTELIGNDRRDMLLAKGLAAVMKNLGNTATFPELVNELFPLEIPEREQTPEDIVALLSCLSDGPKHSNTGGSVPS